MKIYYEDEPLMELTKNLISGSSFRPTEDTNTCWSLSANVIYARFETGICASQ